MLKSPVLGGKLLKLQDGGKISKLPVLGKLFKSCNALLNTCLFKIIPHITKLLYVKSKALNSFCITLAKITKWICPFKGSGGKYQ